MKVYIADHSQIVRARIINVLSELRDVTVVGSARSVSDALTGISLLRPDVVFLDFQLWNSCSIDLLSLLKASRPDLQIIVVRDPSVPYGRTRLQNESAAADFLIDTSSEFERIGEILSDLKRASM